MTQDNFEYLQNQRLIKDDDGGLQDAYDQDKERGLNDDEGWSKEAFDGAIRDYKLMVRTIRWTRVFFALSDCSLAMAS